MKKVHWKKVHEIISDMGWEKSVGKKRFQNYLPHNTFLFAGTEDEAAQLAEHRFHFVVDTTFSKVFFSENNLRHVYWVGARNPLHKLSGPLQDRSGKLLKDYREANLSPEERGHDPNVIRLQFHRLEFFYKNFWIFIFTYVGILFPVGSLEKTRSNKFKLI